MSMLDAALAWAARGFRVFPLAEGTKDKPLVSHTREATTDPAMIRAWWQDPVTGQSRNHNVGVSTTGMVVVDIDVRSGKPGLTNFMSLTGGLIGDTLTVRSPSGGLHCYYSGPDSAGLQGQYGLGEGLDIRSHGNYVVGPGSYTLPGPKTVEGRYVVEVDAPVAAVPAPIARRLKPPLTRENASTFTINETPGLVARAVAFLTGPQAPPAVQGQNGDDATYRTACRLRDLGVSEHGALALLLANWNDRCVPPWEPDDLAAKVENAYNYATGTFGQLSPETHFTDINVPPVPEPVIESNSNVFVFGNAKDPQDIPLRPWVMTGMLMRGQVSMLAGPGGAGKSLASLTLAAHLALGRQWLSFVPKYGAAKSIIFDAEDDVTEMSRRLWALCQFFRFPFDEVRRQIALVSYQEISLRVTQGDPPEIHESHVRTLIDAARADDVGLVALGPLVALHSTTEEDNNRMAFVVEILKGIAERANVALLVGAHVSKPSGTVSRAGDAYSLRGAGSVINSARFAHTIFTPTEPECEKYGIPVDERHSYARLDDAKANHAKMSGRPNWLKRVSVRMPNGDDVGVLAAHDIDMMMDKQRLLFATHVVAGMKAAAKATCSLTEAATFVKAADPLLAKMTLAQLRSRTMQALAAPIVTPEGAVRMMQDGATAIVVLE